VHHLKPLATRHKKLAVQGRSTTISTPSPAPAGPSNSTTAAKGPPPVPKAAPGDEDVLYRGRVHPAIFLTPALLLVLALGSGVVSLAGSDELAWVILLRCLALFCAVAFLLNGADALVRFFTTTLVVTPKAVVASTGLLRRQHVEILRGQLEGININQSLPGRLFGYGDLGISGSGLSQVVFRGLADPLAFRKVVRDLATSG
jgi:hypothetical protein